MRKALNALALLAALSVGAATAVQASADNCCPNGVCGSCCKGCTQCSGQCSGATCCKK